MFEPNPTAEPREPMKIVAINLPLNLHQLLIRAARAKQHRAGGRASVSALVSELVARHAVELKTLSSLK
jgi:hypothetical protein